jgi:hypothetical protein
MAKMFKLSIAFVIALSVIACENRKTGTVEETGAEKAIGKTAAQAAAEKIEESKTYADFTFEETEFDFGTIGQGDVVKHSFKFTNTGDAPLMISDIKTTCGCTTPQYTKDPVGPGESGEILVQFNSAGKAGVINKRVTIYANVQGGTDMIAIKCLINQDKSVAGPFKQPAS